MDGGDGGGGGGVTVLLTFDPMLSTILTSAV